MNNQLSKTSVPGSLAHQAKQNGLSIAESFVNADVIVLVDTSGSMGTHDETKKSRYERACDELMKIQASMSGKIAVLSFSDNVEFCPIGIPKNLGSGTMIGTTLEFARIADVPDMKFILISDGAPDDPTRALEVAARYKNPISTIYIGPEGGEGQRFLNLLASKSGGKSISDFSALHLENSIKGLLK